MNKPFDKLRANGVEFRDTVSEFQDFADSGGMSDYDLYHNDFLREQVKNAYKPLDLYSSDKNAFFCPKCDVHLTLCFIKNANNQLEKYLVHAECKDCKAELYFKLPDIKKKRVYLDQSILSELYNTNASKPSSVKSTDWKERLLAKILLTKRLQKVSFIISDLHVLETLPMTDEAHRDALWGFSNALADGNICGDLGDAFEYEIYSLLDGEIPKNPKFPANCYMDKDIDAWSIRSPVLMSNSWRLRLNNNWNDFRNQSRQGFEQTLKNQATQIPSDSSVQQCIEHMKNLYLLDIFDGIKYAEVFAENLKICYDWNDAFEFNLSSVTPFPVFIERPVENGYAHVILQATLDHNNSSMQIETLRTLREKVEMQGIDAFPSTMLQATFEGEVLHRWINGLQANPKKFNENYGMSKVMDIIHLAVFLPIVDVITVDNATFNRCQQVEIKTIISKYPSSILLRANENQFGLEKWLDELLNEPESAEFKAARRLFFGMNLQEEEQETANLIAEVLDRYISQSQHTTF